MASQETFTERSRETQSVPPQVWQIELVDQVTWCRNVTRTRLAQKNISMAPCQDQTAVEEFQKPPITPGTASVNRTIRGKRRWTVWIFLSASRSGAYFCFEVLFSSNSQ